MNQKHGNKHKQTKINKKPRKLQTMDLEGLWSECLLITVNVTPWVPELDRLKQVLRMLTFYNFYNFTFYNLEQATDIIHATYVSNSPTLAHLHPHRQVTRYSMPPTLNINLSLTLVKNPRYNVSTPPTLLTLVRIAYHFSNLFPIDSFT